MINERLVPEKEELSVEKLQVYLQEVIKSLAALLEIFPDDHKKLGTGIFTEKKHEIKDSIGSLNGATIRLTTVDDLDSVKFMIEELPRLFAELFQPPEQVTLQRQGLNLRISYGIRLRSFVFDSVAKTTASLYKTYPNSPAHDLFLRFMDGMMKVLEKNEKDVESIGERLRTAGL